MKIVFLLKILAQLKRLSIIEKLLKKENDIKYKRGKCNQKFEDYSHNTFNTFGLLYVSFVNIYQFIMCFFPFWFQCWDVGFDCINF